MGVSLSSDMKVDLWQEGTGGNEVSFLPVFDGGKVFVAELFLRALHTGLNQQGKLYFRDLSQSRPPIIPQTD